MPSIGPAELVLVFIIALLVLGPKRLPEVGRQIGRAMREFRAATSTIRAEMGVDDLARDVRDIRSSVGVDDVKRDVTRGVDDVKGAFRVDAAVKDADAQAKEQAASRGPTPGSTAGETEGAGGTADTSLTAAAGALFAAPPAGEPVPPADDPVAAPSAKDAPGPSDASVVSTPTAASGPTAASPADGE